MLLTTTRVNRQVVERGTGWALSVPRAPAEETSACRFPTTRSERTRSTSKPSPNAWGWDNEAIEAHLRNHDVDAGPIGTRYGAAGMGPSLYLRDPEGNTVELKG